MSQDPAPAANGSRALVRRLDVALLWGLLALAALGGVFLMLRGGRLLLRPPDPDATAIAGRPSVTVCASITSTLATTASPASTTTLLPDTPDTPDTPGTSGTPGTPGTPAPAASPAFSPVPTIVPPQVDPLDLSALYAGMPFSVSGTGAPGDTVALFDNDLLEATQIVGADGAWQITVRGLSVGEHRLTVAAITPAGARSPTVPVGFLIVLPPAAAAATEAVQATGTAGLVSTATMATPSPVPLSPTPDTTATQITRPANTATMTTAAARLDTTATQQAVEAATGSATPSPVPISPTPDATATQITNPAADMAAISGPRDGAILPPGPVSFSGSAAPGALVTLVDGAGNTLGSGTAGADGGWQVTADLSGAPGVVSLTVLVEDAAGILTPVHSVMLTIAPPVVPVTGGQRAPDAPSWAAAGLILLALAGGALLVGGLVLRAAGGLLRLREQDRRPPHR